MSFSIEKKDVRYLSIVFIFFIFTHFLMLLINGTFWDDYVIWNTTIENIYKEFGPDECNDVFNLYYLRLVFQSFDPKYHILVFRLTSFVALLITLLCSWYVIKYITKDRMFTFFVCLLLATYGFDRTAFLVACLHYAVANMFFMIGLVLFMKKIDNIWAIIGVAFIWFLSLLVWRSCALMIPFTIVVASAVKTKFEYKKYSSYIELLKYTVKTYWPIILSFLSFLLVYKFFLIQSGGHATYYKPGFLNLLIAPVLSVVSAFTTVCSYITLCVKSLVIEYNLLIVILSIILICLVTFIIRPYLIYPLKKNAEKNNLFIFFYYDYFVYFAVVYLWIFYFGYSSRISFKNALPFWFALSYYNGFRNSKFTKPIF